MLKNTFLASAVAMAAMAAPSFAVTLNGTFTINIHNFSDGDGEVAGNVENANSAATVANIANVDLDATITYTGDLDFGIGRALLHKSVEGIHLENPA